MNVNIKWKFLDFVLSTTFGTAQWGRWENFSFEAKEFWTTVPTDKEEFIIG